MKILRPYGSKKIAKEA